MRVVVTGGGGYVGYHIGWALSRGGHHVTLLDLTPPDPEWKVTAPRALWDVLPRGFWGEEHQHPGSVEFVKGNVTNFEDLQHHFKGATAVVHSASYGMSGREQLAPHVALQEKVNVEGTKEVIRAAMTCKVSALVYTSTYNVVFGGQQITGGDETMPLYPLHAHTDHYSRTKAIAEMLVLMADGKCGAASLAQPGSPPTSHCLRTCSLRMNGVMGLGEKKHMHRIMNAIRSGLLILAYGRKDGLVDFIGIQNVVQAHVKALMALLNTQPQHHPNTNKIMCSGRRQDSSSTSDLSSPSVVTSTSLLTDSFPAASETSGLCIVNKSASTGKSALPSTPSCPSVTSASSFPPSLVCGQAFFISDAAPVSYFNYFTPLLEGLGYFLPALTLPLWVILVVAYLQAFTYCLVHKFLPFTPLVTPAEAYKSAVTHYCTTEKATKAFDYSPTRPNDLSQVVEYYRAQGSSKTHKMGLVSYLSLALIFFLPVFIIFIVL